MSVGYVCESVIGRAVLFVGQGPRACALMGYPCGQ